MRAADLIQAAFIGIGATATLDVWLLLLNRVGVPTLPMALIGRWIGHAAQGRFSHTAIRQAPGIAGERALGWLFHYAVGAVFAGVFVGIAGPHWMQTPTPLVALAFGIATVALPLAVMQPAMGLGFAASKTPNPLLNRLRSVVNHAVFGLGLYVSAIAARVLSG